MRKDINGRYISTKAVLIAAILVFIVINTATQYYQSNNVLAEFISRESESKRQQYIRILDTLYKNWTYSIENIASTITNTTRVQDSISQGNSNIQSIISQHANTLFFEKGLQSILILKNGQILTQSPQMELMLDQTKLKNYLPNPYHQIICEETCINYSYIPFGNSIRDKTTIVLLTDVTDLLMEFFQITGQRILIQRTTTKSESPVDQTSWQFLDGAVPLGDSAKFYIQESLEPRESVAKELRDKFITNAGVFALLFLMVLMIILVPPLKRLERIATGLPLLAKNQFGQFRKAIGNTRTRNYLDIDALHDKSLEISFQLEAYFNTISVNNGVASNIPGALIQFKALPFNSYHLTYVSEGIQTISGYAMHELLGPFDNILKIIHVQDLQGFINSINTATGYDQSWLYEFRIYDKSKKIRWLRGSFVPKKELDGSTLWYGVILDVTSLKQAEAAASAALSRRKISKKVREKVIKASQAYSTETAHH